LTITDKAAVFTLTIPVQTDGVTTNCTKSVNGGGIDCNGAASTAACACLIYDAFVATPCTGIATPTRLDGTCSNSILAFARTPGAASYLGPVAATGETVQNGSNGQFLAGSVSTASRPAIAFGDDPDTGLFSTAANYLQFAAGGVQQGYFSGGTLSTTAGYSGGGHIGLGSGPTGYAISWGSGVSLYSPVASQLKVGSAAAGVVVYPQTITCATSGDGNPSTCGGAQTITSNVTVVNCEDADGCSLSLAETNWSATVAGTVTLVAGTTQTGALTLADSAAVTELAGGTNWTPTAGDTLQLVYNPSALTWAEVARADVTP
jgi:hypothetical protein